MAATKVRLTTIAGGLGLALALAFGSAPAASAADLARFVAIETQIDSAIGAFTAAAGDLGSKADSFVAAFNQAKDHVGAAADADAQGDRRHASTELRRAMKKVIGVGFKLRNLKARKTIPSDTRTALLALARPIEQDLRSLRKDL